MASNEANLHPSWQDQHTPLLFKCGPRGQGTVWDPRRRESKKQEGRGWGSIGLCRMAMDGESSWAFSSFCIIPSSFFVSEGVTGEQSKHRMVSTFLWRSSHQQKPCPHCRSLCGGELDKSKIDCHCVEVRLKNLSLISV